MGHGTHRRDGGGVELIRRARADEVEPQPARPEPPPEGVQPTLPQEVDRPLSPRVEVPDVHDDLVSRARERAPGRRRNAPVDPGRDEEDGDLPPMRGLPERPARLGEHGDVARVPMDRLLHVPQAAALLAEEVDAGHVVGGAHHRPERADDEGMAGAARLQESREARVIHGLHGVVPGPIRLRPRHRRDRRSPAHEITGTVRDQVDGEPDVREALGRAKPQKSIHRMHRGARDGQPRGDDGDAHRSPRSVTTPDHPRLLLPPPRGRVGRTIEPWRAGAAPAPRPRCRACRGFARGSRGSRPVGAS